MSAQFPPEPTAILLVDALNEFLSEGGKLWPLTRNVADSTGTVDNLRRLVEAGRMAGFSIVYANHHHHIGNDYQGWRFLNPSHQGAKDFSIFEAGSFGVEVHPDVAPQDGDIIAAQHWTASSFAGTDLDFLLHQHGIDRLIIAGNRANTCIDSTGRYAVELGYQAILVSDAIAAFSDDEMRATIDTNWPAFGHGVFTTDEIIAAIS